VGIRFGQVAGEATAAPLLCLCLLAVAGCGSSHALPASCVARVVDAVARAAGVQPGAVHLASYTANTGAPSCGYTVRAASGRTLSLSVSADGAPQAYYRLERQIVEAGQSFTPTRLAPVPSNVPDLGLDAAWFPLMNQLLTTDGVRLITVTVTWPGASPASKVTLGTAAARPYLGKLHPPP